MAKILFYISSLNRGGAERVLLSVIDFCKEKHEVVLLTDTYMQDEYDLPEDVRRICLSDNHIGGGNRIIAAFQRLYAIRKVCKNESVDLAVAFMGPAGIRLEAATIFMRVKTAIAIRNNPLVDMTNKVKRIALIAALNKADGVIFQMDSQKELFGRKIQEKSAVIYNPVNEKFCIEKYIGERRNIIVTAGRLHPCKNHKLLIDSFADVKVQFPDVKLYIYGDGEYREQLEEYVAQLGIEENVYLPGAVSDIVGEIKDARLFVLSSDTEGMPNALIEAMIMGLTVISTDCPCGGPRTLIRDGENGLLVPMGDRVALSEAIKRVLGDSQFADSLGDNARGIKDLCDRDIIREKWINYLEGLLA